MADLPGLQFPPIGDPSLELLRSQLDEQLANAGQLPAPQLAPAPLALPAPVPETPVSALPEPAAVAPPAAIPPPQLAAPPDQLPAPAPAKAPISPILQLEQLTQQSANNRAELARNAAKLAKQQQDQVKEVQAATARREAKTALQQEEARSAVADADESLRAAVRSSPEFSGRDIAATGVQLALETIGAALDRSGKSRESLGPRLSAIVNKRLREMPMERWQRHIAGLREDRGLELDALGRITADANDAAQAEGLAKAQIYENAALQLQSLTASGQADAAELQASGIPAELEIKRQEALDQAGQAAMANARAAEEASIKRATALGGLRLTEEKTKTERTRRSQIRAGIGLDRERLALQQRAQQAKTAAELRTATKDRIDLALKSDELNARERERAITLPDGQNFILRSKEDRQKIASKMVASEKVSRLLDELIISHDKASANPSWLGSKEAVLAKQRYGALFLSEKDINELGVISETDVVLLEGLLGEDPTSFSVANLRQGVEILRQRRGQVADEMRASLRTASDPAENTVDANAFQFLTREDPEAAAPGIEGSTAALVPVPQRALGRGIPDISPQEYKATVLAVRDAVDAEAANGQLKDFTGRTIGSEFVNAEVATRLADAYVDLGKRSEEMSAQAKAVFRAGDRTRGNSLFEDSKKLATHREQMERELATEQQRLRRDLRDLDADDEAFVASKVSLRRINQLIGTFEERARKKARPGQEVTPEQAVDTVLLDR